MRIAYVADDKTLFDTVAECLEHESRSTLGGHVDQFCPKTYNDDAGTSIIESADVAEYIRMYIDKINELVKIENAR